MINFDNSGVDPEYFHRRGVEKKKDGEGGGEWGNRTIQFNSIQFIYQLRALKGQQENST